MMHDAGEERRGHVDSMCLIPKVFFRRARELLVADLKVFRPPVALFLILLHT